ncbi:MAG: hydantoinase/oxoprolinase family protein [Pseudomonadales bacterium]|nr:hydantoinase/oxoprolinase family protein [Pseudomonadales bacterium]
MTPGARIAVDIGGTFTDVVIERDGTLTSTKVLTTYEDPADGVMTGIDRVLALSGTTPAGVALVLHGTTLATNALIERRGAVTALVTTAGHRDVLEMALENRFEQYDIGIDRPTPLVPRYLRLPVTERLDAEGRVLLPLDEADVRALVPVLEANRVESVAIGFLHAYANPAHERAAAALLRAELPDLYITLASDVCPEIREYERLSTATANAYVRPLMARYLASLADKLGHAGFQAPLLMMTSGGGLTDLATAAAYPIRLVESGPAGGAILAARLAGLCGYPSVVSFDMGGTTAKICLIDDAEPLLSRAFEIGRVYRFKKGSGLPVRIPVIEMVEIGAGGGSIARVDRLQRIQVGPDSAGSEPGPACYGRGGRLPTVTDADLLQGRIQPGFFAGGSIDLDVEAARRALADSVGGPLGLGDTMAAYGIGAVVDENMAAAARAHAAEWGADVAARTLVAYGGAGPLHAAALADRLKIDRIVIPAGAGVGSAVGFLLAPISFEVVRSRYQRLSAFEAHVANALLGAMHGEALAVVEQAAPAGRFRVLRRAAMRYVGQGYEIAVTLPDGELGAEAGVALHAAFETEYRRLYGRVIPGLDVEILSFTLALTELGAPDLYTGAGPPGRSQRVGADGSAGAMRGRLFDPESGAATEVPLVLRSDLAEAGRAIAGPLLIVEDQTTTVVSKGFSVVVDRFDNLVLERLRDRA